METITAATPGPSQGGRGSWEPAHSVDAGLEAMSLPGALGVAEVTRVMEAEGDLQLLEGVAGLQESRGMSKGWKSKETKRDCITSAAHTETPQLTFAGLAVGDGLAEVPVEALLAVVAVPPRRVVPAVEADATALPARELVQLHVEAATPSVQVAVAGCEGRGEGEGWS